MTLASVDIRQHLLDRHMDINLHRVYLDAAGGIATFPLWNLSGQLVGYQKYDPSYGKEKRNDPKYGRYFTWRGAKGYRQLAVWGLESWYLQGTLFVTEGIFDACRFTRLGHSAVATLANSPDRSMRNWFRLVSTIRPVVAICDPGAAGFKLRRVADDYEVIDVPGMPEGDLGDASNDHILQIIRRWT